MKQPVKFDLILNLPILTPWGGHACLPGHFSAHERLGLYAKIAERANVKLTPP